MATPFDNLDLARIRTLLSERLTGHSAALANRRYFDGDHWQEAAGWVGPRPADADEDALRVMVEIQRAFVAQNAIAEVVERHVGGVLGNEPAWGFTLRRPLADGETPSADESARIDEAEAALTEWWDARKVLKTLESLTESLLLAGRATLRLYRVPDAPLPVDLADALTQIYLDSPDPSVSAVITDRPTRQEAAVYVASERSAVDQKQVAIVELSYVDGALTVWRVSQDGQPPDESRLPLWRHLHMHEVARRALITAPIRSLQNQLNLARTMSGRNIVQGGFLERLILNGQMPGVYVDDASAPTGPDGTRKRFVPKPLKVGAGTTNFISGQPIRDAGGRITGYTPASAVYRDPVSTATFEEQAQAAYQAILREARQMHALISGDSTASGASRVQARADFAKSLSSTKIELDACGRWLLEVVLALARYLSNQSDRYADLRATFACRIDTGPLSADERRVIREEVEADLLSPETALAMLGHDDVDAELQRIIAAKRARMELARELAPPAPATPPNAPPDAPDPQPPAQGADADTPPEPREVDLDAFPHAALL